MRFSELRALDFGWVWAGALPGQTLAHLGAEVIKVETRKRPDYMRLGRLAVQGGSEFEQQPMFHAINSGKLSLTVDIATPDGRSLILDLVELCDVVIENFGPGVLERRGLGYDALRARRNDIIMLSLSGAGRSEAFADLRTYASTIAAFSGLDSLCGYPGETCLGVHQSYPDVNASLHGTFALLAALGRRTRTGVGEHIELSQLEAGLTCVAEALASESMEGPPIPLLGNGPIDRTRYAVHDVFRCEGDDAWIAVSIEAGGAEWQGLRTLCARDGTVLPPSPRGSSAADNAELAEWLGRGTAERRMGTLQDQGYAAAMVTRPSDRLHLPYFEDLYPETTHPVVGAERVYAMPWRWDAPPMALGRRAPLLGEHNEYVVRTVLRRGATEYERLTQNGTLR